MKNKKSGQKLYLQAKKLIPNGTNLFGKRSELYLPENWPAYYSRAKGCEIWDLDDNKYLDFTMVGIGANVLGYCDDDVIKACKESISKGNLTTLNAPEDVELANVLLDLHPWASMVKYARTGGEINAIAIRIARAYSNKSHVAICGYHGWHDWYLSANLSDSEHLNGHLLPGLNPLGVPNEMKGLTHAFEYGNINELENLLRLYEIGVLIMEPLRGKEASIEFLNKVRRICTHNNIVLIFDEVTSGFREYIGGHHMKIGVYPDIALFGKTISNGIPMAAAIGKKNIMEKAEETFISSTYWTDRIGPTAALATIQKMKEINSPSKLLKVAKSIRKLLTNAANKNDIKISFDGSLCLTTFELDVNEWQASLTLYTQEMLSYGILSADRIYANTCHDKKALSAFGEALIKVFKLIKECDKDGTTRSRLNGPVRINSFGRVAINNK
tara:strand:+ start:29504 stop:30829 length:1326 start_codon:yes stop_codon:yes gene_type:complete